MRSPVDELLMDNTTIFQSESLGRLFRKWNVHQFFWAAYQPGDHGIVERQHRMIMAMAKRSRISPLEAVFWYSMSPRFGQDEPQKSLFQYEWRHPAAGEVLSVKLGEEFWVKPCHTCCMPHWQKGIVTEIESQNNVSRWYAQTYYWCSKWYVHTEV